MGNDILRALGAVARKYKLCLFLKFFYPVNKRNIFSNNNLLLSSSSRN